MTDSYCFDRAEVRPGERKLLIDRQPATIGARAFDLLMALIERRDRVVPKSELLDVVWPDVVVEENNLQVHISALRKLLGPQAIVTIPGRGYQFALSIKAEGPRNDVPPSVVTTSSPPIAPIAKPRLTNVPELQPPLYGRESDLAQVQELLKANRVTSIVGAGGIGKTRLAQAIARELRDDYADGVWWVELAALSDRDRVAAEVARVLTIPLEANRPAVETVASVLRTQSLLLLLDNCEHVQEAVAMLVDSVSQAAPAVRVLVTSQEPLKTGHELVYRLDALALPASSELAEARRSSAVQLFVGRVQAADPRFTLTAANASAIAGICRRLDGIPLALELAAARVPLLGLDGLQARLDERFQILTGGSRFVLRRHQTLRAALDFSHSLLTADEQATFRRVGVFAGSFSLESAQEVAADEGINAWAVLDHLGALVDKSMVVAESGARPRLRLLETARAYALEKLGDAGETSDLLARHAYATADLIAQMSDEFWHLSDDAWLPRYEPELDNLRAALAWCLHNDPGRAIALAGDSRSLWLELGLQPEAEGLCEKALKLVSEATPQRAVGRLWLALAAMQANVRPAQARLAAARAVPGLRNANEPETLGAALMALVISGKGPMDPQQLEAFEELRRLDSPERPPRMRLLLPNASAWVHRSAGRYEEAMRDFASLSDLAQSCGALQWELAAKTNVAFMALTVGDLDLAISTYREAASRLALTRDRLFYMYSHAELATALLLKAETAAAREALTQAAPLIVRYDLGSRFAATAALLAAQEGRWAATAQLLGYGEAASAAHGIDAIDPADVLPRAQAVQRLAEHVPEVRIKTWKRSGALLSIDEAYELALAVPQT